MTKRPASRRIDPADIERAETVNLADIAVSRGLVLKKVGGELIGPCPRCGGTDRFSINLAKNVFNCRGCSGKGGPIAFVRWLEGCSFPDAIETLTGRARHQVDRSTISLGLRPKAPGDHDRRQREKAAWFWSRRRPITGTIAEAYLREARGIACPLPPTLAFLPPLKHEHHPAMVSAFGLCEEIEPGIIAAPREVFSVHLTLLKPDGTGKADVEKPKIMIGSPSGRPIVLAPPNDLLGLAVTEGIEDGLTVHQALGLGAWAAGAAGFMPKLADAVPGFIDCCTIFADADADHQGERNATRLADRLRERGIETVIEGLVP
ncbi:DUF7146 domain-containing protein [Bradyrhizobium japonicum]|jgi:hypothetical protein|uniref:DUF7146 domain-containing protein n=1 Tax=Bradyrhizobium japonicum TaxID=375 RepID=UPI0020A0CA16|nr:CHC2 zinc finger domain-containing protein [Bradyrhizobium japonicum]MCP1765150.1 hypothetical protein [Bradyrhizobium japonicum]MCP1787287.1 hypothetical protein [Bradyrhizobium japonicum]MCP1809164.1 hypothetical protein [Bradyrhizobium japonicum]MCP1818097.1 hypothetical protein [Bradyrhizobium japonicum]MCP1870394.1 hypothetical protein [Bradyrhizobium japonicum]